MKKNSVVSKILIVIVMLCFLYVFFVSSIIDLANQKDVHEVTINHAYDILEIENSINGIIPLGKDCYYVGFSAEENNAYIIHAGKSWLSDNFDAAGNALADGGYYISALSKRAGDFDVEQELSNRLSQIEVSPGLEYGYVLELNYVRDAVLRMVAGVVLLALVIVGYIFNNSIPGPLKLIYIIVLFAVLFFSLATI